MLRWLRSNLGKPRSVDTDEESDWSITERELTPSERALLLLILENASFEGAQELRAQIPSTTITGGVDTFFDLEVRGPAPVSSCEDGPIPMRAFVKRHEGGEVLVWVKDGYLSGLEHAWVSDEAPTGMPPPGDIRIADD
jgi:hypothetical protein